FLLRRCCPKKNSLCPASQIMGKDQNDLEGGCSIQITHFYFMSHTPQWQSLSGNLSVAPAGDY
ncbi:MAG TPA: hypothetical protein VJC18_09965, partial [bacterium]|nr:hypothetical protein [bacterium]